jgi:site-specific recombinase XerD
MATIFKRTGSSVWTAKIKQFNKGTDSWEHKNVSTHLTDRIEAQAYANSLEGVARMAGNGTLTRERVTDAVNSILRAAGIEVQAKAPPLGEFLIKFLDGHERRVAPRSLVQYQGFARRIEGYFAKRLDDGIDSFTPSDIDDYYAAIQKGHSTRTANLHLRFVKSLFQRAVALHILTRNPATAVVRLEDDGSEREVLTRREVAATLRVMRAAGERGWALLTILGLHTGARLNEVTHFSATSLEHRAKVAWVINFTQSKTGQKITLPIPTYAAKMLLAHSQELAALRRKAGDGGTSREFIGWLEEAGIDVQRVDRGAKRVPRKSFHSLRHTIATHLTSSGAPDALARKVTGHKNARVHAGYVHADVVSIKAALKTARQYSRLAQSA